MGFFMAALAFDTALRRRIDGQSFEAYLASASDTYPINASPDTLKRRIHVTDLLQMPAYDCVIRINQDIGHCFVANVRYAADDIDVVCLQIGTHFLACLIDDASELLFYLTSQAISLLHTQI